ncbi:MAG: hypothetical protein CVU38_10355 [Chloroflexi bacterium HGW-Chloroflexi-1]|nr:MAG: hypothetical protein CVU38_10355 [Chloroflexi bacterium HGW-Chloroflexi-1]
MRIALTWDSNPAGSGSNYYEDPLETDLDLDVYDPDGQRVGNGISASNDNSYELVDFVAPKTGQYAIGVYKKSGVTELLNWLGLAWVKVPQMYLPLILSD